MFEQFSLKNELHEYLTQEGITEPTEVQLHAIPEIKQKESVYVHASTGSGKTLTFLLPILNSIDYESDFLQCIILAPTHELASQIIEVIRSIKAKTALPIRSQLLLGQTQLKRQVDLLKKKPQIVVGSTGRIQDLIQMKKLKVHKVNSLVLDEADKLMEDPFKADVMKIQKSLLRDIQLICTSATYSEYVFNQLNKFRENLKLVQCEQNTLKENITHVYIECSQYEKNTILKKFLRLHKEEKTIVFFHKNEDIENVHEQLKHNDYKLVSLHGLKEKKDRIEASHKVKKGDFNVLLCSDIGARGLHVDKVDNAVHYNLPSTKEQYLHRAGRVGRSGEAGHCLSLVSKHDLSNLEEFDSNLGLTLIRACPKTAIF